MNKNDRLCTCRSELIVDEGFTVNGVDNQDSSIATVRLSSKYQSVRTSETH